MMIGTQMMIGRSDSQQNAGFLRGASTSTGRLAAGCGSHLGPAVTDRMQRPNTRLLSTRIIRSQPLASTGPFSNRVPLVNSLLLFFCCRTGVTVLSAVGRIRRNIWFEAQALQCPQRAHIVFMWPKALLRSRLHPPAPSPRRATVTSEAMLRMDLGEGLVRRRPAARTSGMARLSARCCA